MEDREPMSAEEWAQCSDTNAMLAAVEPPPAGQLAAFNLACCRRIRNLIKDDATLKALDALESSSHGITIPGGLALAAQEITSLVFGPLSPPFNPSHSNAASAVAQALCRYLPPDRFRLLMPGILQYARNGLDNAGQVALYCQYAAGRAADVETDNGDYCDYYGTDDVSPPPGLDEAGLWLRKRAEQAEASAQCDLIRSLFARRIEPEDSPEAEL